MDHATNRAQVKECQIESTWVFTDLLRHPGNAQGAVKNNEKQIYCKWHTKLMIRYKNANIRVAVAVFCR